MRLFENILRFDGLFRIVPKPWRPVKLSERILYILQYTSKTLFVLLIPAIPTAIIDWLYYVTLWKRGIHFSADAKELVIAGVMPCLGLMYGILAGLSLNFVWEKYTKLRYAVKDWDLDTYVNLRDENMTPLMHILIGVVSLLFLSCFLGYPYESAGTGLIFVSMVGYLLCLYCVIVIEVDDPFSGAWFIRTTPDEWLKMNVRDYRKSRNEERRKKQNGCSYGHHEEESGPQPENRRANSKS